MQWRVAISWISASFITSFFAPILFQLSGPVVAGQMGMTVTLNQVLLAISSNWVVTKAPRLGVLIAQRKYKELDRVFSRSFGVSLAVVSSGAVVIWGLACLLYLARHALATRILSPLPMGLFLVATVLSSANTSLAVYLRAHKREPLAKIYLVSGILILALGLILGASLHAVGVTGGYLAVIALLQLPWSWAVFYRCRINWHKEPLSLPKA
jgi:O-antigen/teichoic acid export membrane protein